MNTQSRSITLLFNPFFYIAGARALGIGLAAIVLAALVGSWGNTHFDGVLDTHAGAAAPLWLYFTEGLVDWLCLAVVLWLAGRIISKTAFRAIDILGTQALARWPTLFISLIALPKAFNRFGNELMEQFRQGKLQFDTAHAIIFLAIAIAMIPFVVWTILLMYKSFSVSCNVRGGKAIGMFIGALLVAECLSKVCLAPVFHHVFAQAGDAVQTVSSPRSVPAQSAVEPTSETAESGERFAELLAKEDFGGAVARFDETMRRVMPETTLRDDWLALLKQAGAFQKRLGSRVEEQQGYKIAFVTCQFERTLLDLKVVFDSQGQVAGLFFVPSPPAPDAAKAKGN